ncbi:hypothetical protein BV20DRAFT_939713 [Pilatotrama ljubarskyi]|nr:hypothetical protein BV20DRAFT_939713 [Pilatotrama ljubarskyi]
MSCFCDSKCSPRRASPRKLTCVGPLNQGSFEEDLNSLCISLSVLPHLRHMHFYAVPFGIPWRMIKLCLTLPNIDSVDIDLSATCSAKTAPFPDEKDDPAPNALTYFAYRTYAFREQLRRSGHEGFEGQYVLERNNLSRLVCGMHGTAQYLALPMESAPLAAMSELSWPRIHHLFLRGRYSASHEAIALPRLLRCMPSLRTLCIQAAQPPELFRAPVLGRSRTPPVNLADLRSLIMAYPDAEDSIFDINAPNLTCISLRDEPRYYFTGRTHEPILKSSECLRILQRMESPLLESLEVVYEADDADGDLLRHICTAYTRLARLELHRYRPDQDDDVPYIAIATQLSSIRTLQSAHLNLDFRERPPINCSDDAKVMSWFSLLLSRSDEILAILEAACPKFERLGALDPRRNCCTWVEFRPSWYAGQKFNADSGELDRA